METKLSMKLFEARVIDRDFDYEGENDSDSFGA